MSTESLVNKVVDAIDESTMLGAAWDCLSTEAKDRFKQKLAKIVEESNAYASLP